MTDYRRVASLVALVIACDSTFEPGRVAQGGKCEYDTDCAPVPGGIAQCTCISGRPGSRRCDASYPVDLLCGSMACTRDQICTFSATDPSGACLPRAGEGASCRFGTCLPDLFCNANGICERPHAIGQPCEVSSYASCLAPAFCDRATATCLAPRAVGQPCDPLEYEREQCVSGTICSFASNTCVEPQLNGAPCNDPAECLSRYCSRSSHRCETRQCRG